MGLVDNIKSKYKEYQAGAPERRAKALEKAKYEAEQAKYRAEKEKYNTQAAKARQGRPSFFGAGSLMAGPGGQSRAKTINRAGQPYLSIGPQPVKVNKKKRSKKKSGKKRIVIYA